MIALNEKTENPIGVMDSGMGGISVLKEITALLPNEKYIFYGDSANAPYGSRTNEEIYSLTEAMAEKLIAQQVKAMVIACNTASSVAGAKLRAKYPDIPIIAIEPALKPAVIACPGGRVLVLATEATLREQKFATLMENFKDRAEIIKLPLPGLPEFVERGELDSPKLRKFFMDHFASVGIDKNPVDGVVLGCTHYPFVRRVIQELLGENVKIFDGAAGTARQLRRKLYSHGLLRQGGAGEILWQNSSPEERYQYLAMQLYNMPVK